MILLFLNDIDEQVLMLMQVMLPAWVEEIESDIIQSCYSKFNKRKEISEVIKDLSDANGQSSQIDLTGMGYDFVQTTKELGGPSVAIEDDIAIDCENSVTQNGSHDKAKYLCGKKELKLAMDKVKVVEDENVALKEKVKSLNERLKILEKEENENKAMKEILKSLEERLKILEVQSSDS